MTIGPTKLRACLFATALAAVPTSAWAHGDHEGLHGLVHVLTEPLHLGGLLALAVGGLLLGRRVKSFLRARNERRATEEARRD